MDGKHSFIAGTLAELTRRKVLRSVGAYAVTVFVLLQLMDAAVDPLRLPAWLPTLIVIVLILGFPLVFLLAWQFDITPRGLRKASTSGVLTRSQNSVLIGLCLLAMFGLGYVFKIYYAGILETEVAGETVGRQFTAPENSIAVLPFSDLSAQGDQAYFSDGVAEEILNLLAQVRGLHVAARTSSFSFRDQQHDVREIGRLLNVSTVLEGSIRSDGNRIRLTAQLINVEDGFHIWSKSYDREIDDLFAIQDEVASQIAEALVQSFAGLEQKSVGKTDSLAAANAYRTGRLHWWRRTPAELETALGFFAEALELDAAYAPAYAAMADTWMVLALYGNITPLKAAEKAQPMIEKALALEPESGEAFAALGLTRWQIGQLDAAESALRRATELNEDYIPAQLWLAGVLGEQGRYPEEHQVLEQAMALDPLNELLVINYADNLRVRGDFAAGRESLRKLIELRPDSTMLLRSLAMQELGQGELVEGWKLAQRSYQLEPDNPADIEAMAKALIQLGQTKRAEELLLSGLEQSSQNVNLQYTGWLFLLASGRYEEAERLVRETMGSAGENIPAGMRKVFDEQLGLIALAREDYPAARQFLESAIGTEDEMGYASHQVLVLSFAALVARRLGDEATAGEHLLAAERGIQRERLNGVDDAQINYTEGALLAMRDDVPAALQKLQQAYDRGFRDLWMLRLDWRLNGLRQEQDFVALESRIGQDIEQAWAEIRALSLASL